MSTNNNSDNAKSKIEQIRLDLEKKLAALEEAKKQTIDSDSNEIPDSSDIVGKDDIVDKEIKDVEKNSEETKDTDAKSFVEQISNIEKSSIIENDDVVEDDTLFEISDEIENVEEGNIIEEIEDEIENSEEEIIIPPITPTSTTIKENINFNEIESNESNQSEEEVVEISNEPLDEEPKKSKLNFLIYGLLAVLLLVVGYFAMDYIKGKNNLDSEKTKMILSEYENRRYQDSIRLLDAEKRLSEFESQKYIDSIANADRIKLINNTNTTSADKKDKPTSKWSRDNAKSKKTKANKWNKDNTTVKVVDNIDTDNTNTSSTIETPTEVVETNVASVEKEKEIIKEPKKVETLTTIEKAPIYPGCAGAGSETAKKRCMISKINKFVNKNFNSYIAQDIGLKPGTQKISVKFIIDKNGYVNVSRVRATHPALKKEAIRVVNKLPKMIPGKSNGKSQNVNYFLPIIFNIE